MLMIERRGASYVALLVFFFPFTFLGPTVLVMLGPGSMKASPYHLSSTGLDEDNGEALHTETTVPKVLDCTFFSPQRSNSACYQRLN